MVAIHVKHAQDGDDDDEFLLQDFPSNTSVEDIYHHVVQICNRRYTIQSLGRGVDHLLLFHPSIKSDGKDDLLALRRAVSEAQGYASKDQVMYKKAMRVEILEDHVKDIEKELKSLAAVKDSEILQELLSANYTGTESFHSSRIQIWWASKELLKSKRLHDYVGRNEKTKIVVRMQFLDLSRDQPFKS